MPAPSLHQRRVLAFVRAGRGHALVRATAGAGKTTTLVRVAEALPADLRVCFLAFARDAARELRARLPRRVVAVTVHALGRRTLAAALRRRGVTPTLAPGKVRRLVAEQLDALGDLDPEERALCAAYLGELIAFARLDLIDSRDPARVRALDERYALLPPTDRALAERVRGRLRHALRRGAEEAFRRGHLDFGDMLYLPQVFALPPPRFDVVCVDEAQDYSALALAFTQRLIAPGGRLLFVGDPRQSIFGFAGADSDALGRIVRRTDAAVLPLTTSYRCPRSHVALARRLAPEMAAAPGAIEGRVLRIAAGDLEAWARPGDLVLCRHTAPLVAACLRLLRAGVPARVWGGDLRGRLLTLATATLGRDFAGWRRRLTREKRRERARIAKTPLSRSASERLLARRLDPLDTLERLLESLAADGPPDPERLRSLLERTLAPEGGATVDLATVHRAKGQEAERVLILHPELLEATPSMSDEAKRAEACVQFVALTRAKRELIFVMQERDDGDAGGGAGFGAGWRRRAKRLTERVRRVGA